MGDAIGNTTITGKGGVLVGQEREGVECERERERERARERERERDERERDERETATHYS